jgi:hypothetical protein
MHAYRCILRDAGSEGTEQRRNTDEKHAFPGPHAVGRRYGIGRSGAKIWRGVCMLSAACRLKDGIGIGSSEPKWDSMHTQVCIV